MNKIPKFRLFTIFALAFLAGIATASIFVIDYERSYIILVFTLFLIILTALLNLILKNYHLIVISFSFLGLFLGLFYYSQFEFKHRPNIEYDKEMQISGQIIRKPDVTYKSQKVVVKTGGQKILVTLPHYPAVYFGDQVAFTGKIQKPMKFDDFDYGQYLKKDLIFGTVSSPQNVTAGPQKLASGQEIYKGLYIISDKFESSLNRILPEPHASLAAGLVLGIKRNIPDSFKDDLSTTGLTHIIALSGYNVTIIVAVLVDLLIGFINRKRVFLIGTFFILAFVVLTGAASSVVRAAIFSLLIMFGKTIGRESDQTNLILLAAVAMILFNPFSLALDVGFQLSFLAFCGLIYLSPIVGRIFEEYRTKDLSNWIKKPLTETLSAQIAVFPLIMVVFGQVSIIGPISNVLVLWSIPWAMGLSFATGLLGIIFLPLGKLAALITWPLLQFIIKAVEAMAKIPGASVEVGKGIWPMAILLYLLLIASIFFWNKKFKIVI